MNRWQAMGVYLGLRKAPNGPPPAAPSRLRLVTTFVYEGVAFGGVEYLFRRNLLSGIVSGLLFAVLMSGWRWRSRRQQGKP